MEFKGAETAWRDKTPAEKWKYFYNFCKCMGDILQLRVLSNLKVGIVGYIPCVTGVVHYTLLIYTVYYYVKCGHFAECLPSFCTFGVVTSAYLTYWTTISTIKYEWKRLLNVSGKFIYHDDLEPTNYNRICEQSINESLKTYIITMTVIILSFVGAVIGPFYTFVHNGELVTLYSLKLPYFDQDPYMEFMINVVWQFLITLIGGISLVLTEGAMTLINDTISLSSKLFCFELNELSDYLEGNYGFDAKSHRKLKRYCMKIAYFDEFIKSSGNLLYWRNFIGPPLFSFAIAVSIYCQKRMGYPAGYGTAVVSYVQMAVMCYTGQNVTDRNDRLLRALYEFKWYLLPQKAQTDVMHMIVRLQQEISFTIGPFEKLNLETLKVLSQKIYTFLMFLTHSNI